MIGTDGTDIGLDCQDSLARDFIGISLVKNIGPSTPHDRVVYSIHRT